MSLYIGVTSAGSDLKDSTINSVITQFAVSCAQLKQRDLIPEGPSLDITFMLPGKLEKPNFSGMQMGGYTSENKTLFFEIAVPDHIINSELSRKYLTVSIQDVLFNAAEFFEESNITFDTPLWKKQLSQVIQL